MFLPIPGNHNILISLSGAFATTDPQVCIPVDQNNKVRINLYSEEVTVDVQWLYLLAKYQTYLPSQRAKDLLSVHFVLVDDKRFKLPLNMKMVFRDRIMYKPGFAIVPNFVRYAVSQDGVVIDLHTGDNVVTAKRYAVNSYTSVEIFDPVIDSKRSVQVHRLVAFAWVNNPSPTERHYVNHIDGNKQNNHYKNLEWCTMCENNVHAVLAGLNSQATGGKVRNIETGEIHSLPSVALLCYFVGLRNRRPESYFRNKRENSPINGKFEVRLDGDDRPWFFTEANMSIKQGFFIVDVLHPDGTLKTFSDVRDLKSAYKLWNVGSSVSRLTKVLKERMPELIITVRGREQKFTLEAKQLESGVVLSAEETSVLVANLSRPRKHIVLKIAHRGYCLLDGYVIRKHSTEPWPEDPEHEPLKPRCISCLNEATGERLTFPSLRAAEKETGVNRKGIKNFLKTGGRLLGYEFFKQED